MFTTKWNVLLDNSQVACITKVVLRSQVKYFCKDKRENGNTSTIEPGHTKAPQRDVLKQKGSWMHMEADHMGNTCRSALGHCLNEGNKTA